MTSSAGPRLRPTLSDIPAYRPGKAAAGGGGPAYKISSNENPYPPLPGVLEAVAGAAQEMNRYPDMFAVGLVPLRRDALRAVYPRLWNRRSSRAGLAAAKAMLARGGGQWARRGR